MIEEFPKETLEKARRPISGNSQVEYLENSHGRAQGRRRTHEHEFQARACICKSACGRKPERGETYSVYLYVKESMLKKENEESSARPLEIKPPELRGGGIRHDSCRKNS